MKQSAVDLLLEATEPLCAPLHAAFGDAGDIARDHFETFDLGDPQYAWGSTHLTRLHAIRLMHKHQGRLGGWTMLDPTLNGRFEFHSGLCAVRLLHDPRVTVPAPGPNRARQGYYENPGLNLFGDRASKLLGLWNVDPDSGEVAIRMVRPIGTWRFKERAKVDLDFMLPGDPLGLGELRFQVERDLGIDMPAAELSEGQTGDQPSGW